MYYWPEEKRVYGYKRSEFIRRGKIATRCGNVTISFLFLAAVAVCSGSTTSIAVCLLISLVAYIIGAAYSPVIWGADWREVLDRLQKEAP